MEERIDRDLLVLLKAELLGTAADPNLLVRTLDLRYRSRLFGSLRSKGLYREDCEEVIQEVWVDLLKCLGSNRFLLFSMGDITDAASLVEKLRQGSDETSRLLWERLSLETRRSLVDWNLASKQREALLEKGLNEILGGASIYDEKQSARAISSKDAQVLFGESLSCQRNPYLNRLLIEHAYPLEVAKAISLTRLDSYVLRIAKTNAWDSLRKSKRYSAHIAGNPDDSRSKNWAAPQFEAKEEEQWEVIEQQLRKVVSDVRGKAKDVGKLLLLHLRDGLTMREIFEKLQLLGKKHTKGQVKRAHGYLIKMLKESINRNRKQDESK